MTMESQITRADALAIFQDISPADIVQRVEQLNGIVAANTPLANSLRNMPYADYLRSDEWFIRAALVKAFWQKCAVCGKAAGPLEVHHNTYARRGVEPITDLISLCGACHDLHHKGVTT